ncbi:uncharacterized protein SCHCODRAFT_02519105 [Schizophyllum commune H4-8]|nr:uncharacterized protein SCHCODRAFT_02519105 [Schizophyllum commune H4-8]KAI5886152.1 hypothetical protein SCHCODRAFT_02519105 [Schizophyllum commune H4-8]
MGSTDVLAAQIDANASDAMDGRARRPAEKNAVWMPLRPRSLHQAPADAEIALHAWRKLCLYHAVCQAANQPPVSLNEPIPDEFARPPSRRRHARDFGADICDDLGSGGAMGEY